MAANKFAAYWVRGHGPPLPSDFRCFLSSQEIVNRFSGQMTQILNPIDIQG